MSTLVNLASVWIVFFSISERNKIEMIFKSEGFLHESDGKLSSNRITSVIQGHFKTSLP